MDCNIYILNSYFKFNKNVEGFKLWIRYDRTSSKNVRLLLTSDGQTRPYSQQFFSPVFFIKETPHSRTYRTK